MFYQNKLHYPTLSRLYGILPADWYRQASATFVYMKLGHYWRLVRLHRPIGILLLLWPTMWALWLAGNGQPPSGTVLVFIAGVVLMRSAGCAINDYADKDFDSLVTRTRDRPLAIGEVTPWEALTVFLILSFIAFLLVLTQNIITIAMSVVGLVLAIVYPFTKRFIHLPQLILGAAFGWAVPMAFAAVTGSVSHLGWWLFISTLIWALIYDTQYAMVDRVDDLRIGIKSAAILFGVYDRLIIGILQVTMLIMLAYIGLQAQRGWFYFAGLLVAVGLAVYQHHLIRYRQPAGCFKAFLHNHYFGMVIFFGLLLDYTLADLL